MTTTKKRLSLQRLKRQEIWRTVAHSQYQRTIGKADQLLLQRGRRKPRQTTVVEHSERYRMLQCSRVSWIQGTASRLDVWSWGPSLTPCAPREHGQVRLLKVVPEPPQRRGEILGELVLELLATIGRCQREDLPITERRRQLPSKPSRRDCANSGSSLSDFFRDQSALCPGSLC